MDTLTTGQIAESLGVTAPTVRRAAGRLHLTPDRSAGGHRRFAAGEVTQMARLTGITPRVDGLTRTETAALAALARHGLGLRSERAVARASGLSPTTAGRCLDSLRRKRLAHLVEEVVAEGSARTVTTWKLLVGPEWFGVADQVSRTVRPAREAAPTPEHVPSRFWHLFWNQSPADLRVSTHGSFIADRMIRSDDLVAWAWALNNLPVVCLEATKRTRGLDPRRCAMVDNALAARR